jgi:hypothetical protein
MIISNLTIFRRRQLVPEFPSDGVHWPWDWVMPHIRTPTASLNTDIEMPGNDEGQVCRCNSADENKWEEAEGVMGEVLQSSCDLLTSGPACAWYSNPPPQLWRNNVVLLSELHFSSKYRNPQTQPETQWQWNIQLVMSLANTWLSDNAVSGRPRA